MDSCDPADFYDFGGFAYISDVELNLAPADMTPCGPLVVTITWLGKNGESLSEEASTAVLATDYLTVVSFQSDNGRVISENRQVPQNGDGQEQPTSTWEVGRPVIDQHTLEIDDYLDLNQSYVLYIGMIDPETNEWLSTPFGHMVPINPYDQGNDE